MMVHRSTTRFHVLKSKARHKITCKAEEVWHSKRNKKTAFWNFKRLSSTWSRKLACALPWTSHCFPTIGSKRSSPPPNEPQLIPAFCNATPPTAFRSFCIVYVWDYVYAWPLIYLRVTLCHCWIKRVSSPVSLLTLFSKARYEWWKEDGSFPF